MARVFWDTNLFIYLFEKNAEWSPPVIELRRRMLARGDELLTSYVTVGEVIAKSKQLNNAMLARSYLNFFSGGSVELIAFGQDAAQRYGDIRSRERIRPADAMQLACASAARTDLFVTNDSRLSGLVVSGVTFVTGIERVPY
jgi:predicted nucleic acid-binding protein